MKVLIKKRFSHKGTVYVPGSDAEFDASAAECFVRNGLAEEVKTEKKAAKKEEKKPKAKKKAEVTTEKDA